MTKQGIIERTLQVIEQLPEEKAEEISDFAEFIFKRYEESILAKGIQKTMSTSKTYEFLHQEEDIYTMADVKTPYNE